MSKLVIRNVCITNTPEDIFKQSDGKKKAFALPTSFKICEKKR